MKFSYNWLQNYFDKSLPEPAVLADKITFHSSEIEELITLPNDTVLDVKVLPDKSAWLMSHRGLAKELSVILRQPLKKDPFLEEVKLTQSPLIKINKESATCDFYSALLIKGITVGDSPTWLKEKIEVLGQRSINNIVDATNYVMFELGQPLHAFDADKLGLNENGITVGVRQALAEEKTITLSDEEVTLSKEDTVIIDSTNDVIGIAGIKGCKKAAVDQNTKNILLESAHFDRVAVRKSARRLKLQTDAAKRFENGIDAKVAPIALRAVAKLITEIASGEVVAESFSGEVSSEPRTITCTVSKINSVLNLKLTLEDVSDILDRFGFLYEVNGEEFKVTPTFERDDLLLAEELIEDIGRVHGFDHIAEISPVPQKLSEYNARYYYSEKIRNILIKAGFSEIYTSSFRDKDEVKLANALASDKGYLRSTLVTNLIEARAVNIPHRDLLGLSAIKLFEIGTVFSKDNEEFRVGIAVQAGTSYKAKTDDPLLKEAVDLINQALGIELDLIYNKEGVIEFSLDSLLNKLPEVTAYEEGEGTTSNSYKAFSVYPAISRDVAMWVPEGTDVDQVNSLISNSAGELCVRVTHLDTFTKEGRTSYAFRLVFQSYSKTLTDQEIQVSMDNVYQQIANEGWEPR